MEDSFSVEPTSRENLLDVLDYCHRHVQHAEKRLFWFSNIYAVIIVAVLIAGITGRFDPFNGSNSTLLFVFLLFLSIAGIVNTIKQGIVFSFYALQAVAICHSLGLTCNEGAYAAPLYRKYSDEFNTSPIVTVWYWIVGIYLISLWVLTTIIFESFVDWRLLYSAGLGTGFPILIGLIARIYTKSRMNEIKTHKNKFESELKESVTETNNGES